MAKRTQEYHQHVRGLEFGLKNHARRSFGEPGQRFIDGTNWHRYFADKWSSSQQPKLYNRTPIQIERDRILHSAGMRKLTEKYHVLFHGHRRIVRSYATHVNRMSHVARAICRGTSLNADFAEAIALGAKTGGPPFVYASKEVLSEWLTEKLVEIDKRHRPKGGALPLAKGQLLLPFKGVNVPGWVASIKSDYVLSRLTRFVPWAAGTDVETSFDTGQQSYWQLCTDPYRLQSRGPRFAPETMYGVWRHSLGLFPEPNSFLHLVDLPGAASGKHKIESSHATYEGIVVQYADDITWVIENLTDANNAALLDTGDPKIWEKLARHLASICPQELKEAVVHGRDSALYTYFITDMIKTTNAAFGQGGDLLSALRNGDADARIGLSSEAELVLTKMKGFLREKVFSKGRTGNRRDMLLAISKACIELLYDNTGDCLEQFLRDGAALRKLDDDEVARSLELIDDDVCKAQISIDVFSEMSDHDVYNFVGVASL